MKKIRNLIFIYAVWKALQDINRSPRTLAFLEKHREGIVEFGVRKFEKLIYGTDIKKRRRH